MKYTHFPQKFACVQYSVYLECTVYISVEIWARILYIRMYMQNIQEFVSQSYNCMVLPRHQHLSFNTKPPKNDKSHLRTRSQKLKMKRPFPHVKKKHLTNTFCESLSTGRVCILFSTFYNLLHCEVFLLTQRTAFFNPDQVTITTLLVLIMTKVLLSSFIILQQMTHTNTVLEIPS